MNTADDRMDFYRILPKKQIPTYLKLLAGLMVALVFLYFLMVDILPALAVRFVPVSEEIKMGDAFYKGLEQKQEMDAAASELVQDFADHLHLSQQYPIRVSVANSEEVNAYALPGGHIIVNRGILKILHSPESLAALLGHEATHINRRHSLKSMVSGMGTGLLISLVAGNGGGLVQFLIGNANMLRELSYSRQLEEQADLEGMQLALKNRINPSGMIELMEALKDQHQDSEIRALSFLSTHPLTDDRIDAAKKFIADHPYSAKSGKENQTIESLSLIWKQIREEAMHSGN